MEMAGLVDAMLVVDRATLPTPTDCGAGREGGRKAHLIDDASMIEPQWLDGVARIGDHGGCVSPDACSECHCRLRELGRQDSDRASWPGRECGV